MELALRAVSWGMTEPETLEGLFQLENVQKMWSFQSPRQREKANQVLAGPQAGAQLCPARPPHLLGGEQDTFLFQLLPAQLSHASLSGAVRGRNGMTESPGHSSPSWARSPWRLPHPWLTRTALCTPGGRAEASSGNYERVVK